MNSSEFLVTCLDDPCWFPVAVDFDREQLVLFHTNRTQLAEASFLDHRLAVGPENLSSLPLGALWEAFNATNHPQKVTEPRYIFHTAFCCSTLLARCLDIPGKNLALKEPQVLMQLSNMKRHNPWSGQAVQGIREYANLKTLLNGLLSRRFTPAENLLLKPTNAANNLIDDVLSMPSTHSSVLLYSQHDQFLASVIKKGEECRGFVRKLFGIFRYDLKRFPHLDDRSILQLTDLQIASLVWMIQIDNYLRVLSQYPQCKIATLDCDRFLDAPGDTLQNLSEHFDLAFDSDDIQNVVDGDALKKYSKGGRESYAASSRKAEYAVILDSYRGEIDKIRNWARRVHPELMELEALPRAL